MDILVASLSPDPTRLCALVAKVDANWWRFPPWARSHGVRPNSAQDCLWLTAAEVLGSPDRLRPRDVADSIAALALQRGSGDDSGIVEIWRQSTHGILRGDATIQHDDWRKQPVGLAIQLLLARPEPTAFKTWFDDESVNLPPAVAWSAATLCGLFHGYKGLDTRFRGKLLQREVIAVQALHMCLGEAGMNWPEITNDPPQWRKVAGNFVLSWGDCDFACKRQGERGKRYASDLGSAAVQREAVAIAKSQGWPCLSRVLTLNEGKRPLFGPGVVEALDRAVNVRGSVRIGLLPQDHVQDEVDAHCFRRLLAVEPGRLPAPPASPICDQPFESADGIPGLRLVPNFLTETEEEEIIAEIDRNDWNCELKRRVQHYGWRYDYKSRQVDPTMRIGPLPEWANRVAQRLFNSGYVPELPDQLIVNEYKANQGIAPHVDSPSSFADGVAMISLLETWEMEFRKKGGKDKVTHKLERRSVAVLTGEARYGWTHELPKRKTEPGTVKPGNKKPSRVARHRRISLTFRKVIDLSKTRPAKDFQRCN